LVGGREENDGSFGRIVLENIAGADRCVPSFVDWMVNHFFFS
jgi:hypothetical protein